MPLCNPSRSDHCIKSFNLFQCCRKGQGSQGRNKMPAQSAQVITWNFWRIYSTVFRERGRKELNRKILILKNKILLEGIDLYLRVGENKWWRFVLHKIENGNDEYEMKMSRFCFGRQEEKQTVQNFQFLEVRSTCPMLILDIQRSSPSKCKQKSIHALLR